MRSPWELYRVQTLGITINTTPPTTTLIGRDERRSEDGNGNGDSETTITEQSKEIRRTAKRKRKPRKEFYALQNTQQQLDPQVGNL